MKPKSPFTQSFDELPESLPVYSFRNVLLPGGQVPLELSEAADISMLFDSLKSHQLIGLAQPKSAKAPYPTYDLGGAGRIRQYRERSDGRLNVMLAGVCRFRIISDIHTPAGYRKARVDWSEFQNDLQDEAINMGLVDLFKAELRAYFGRYQMQVDWPKLESLAVEDLVNNLVLVMSLEAEDKQRLLEVNTVKQRIIEFAGILNLKLDPVIVGHASGRWVN